MARSQEPSPARLIISIIYSSMDAVVDCLKMLERRFGRVQFETAEMACSNAECYKEEMGQKLHRRLFSFEKLVEREALPRIKLDCQKTEPHFADKVDDFLFRTVNIDPGFMTAESLVMASRREYGHRIYLGSGVFAELVLIHSKGRFVRLPWTNSDFCRGEAVDFLERVHASLEAVKEVV